MLLAAHMVCHVWHTHLAAEEAVVDQLLEDRLLLHHVDAVGPGAQHEHVRRAL